MSWHDQARTHEAEADSELREEMRSLLGCGPRKPVEARTSPEMILLADDLRREAKRRNHTVRKQSSWMLMAAALPFALVLGGLGAWGVGQKHRADRYATTVQQKDAELQRMATAFKAPLGIAPPAKATVVNTFQLATRTLTPKAKSQGKELIIPVERSPEALVTDTQRVKAH